VTSLAVDNTTGAIARGARMARGGAGNDMCFSEAKDGKVSRTFYEKMPCLSEVGLSEVGAYYAWKSIMLTYVLARI
jgi:hypothetical protein